MVAVSAMSHGDNPFRVLVLCTGNRCRSQMAQGWLQYFADRAGHRIEVCSAGTAPKGVHPLAIDVMAKAGVDITGHASQHVDEYAGQHFDLVITVCDRAREACPILLGAGAGQFIHHAFEDPDQPGKTEQELLVLFVTVRDQIRDWTRMMIDAYGPGY